MHPSGSALYILSKVGSGTIVLSGTNTYQGGIDVYNGALTLLGNQSGATGSIQVSDSSNTNADTLNIGSGTQTVPTTVEVGPSASIGVGGITGSSYVENLTAQGSSGFPTVINNSGSFLAGRESGTAINSFATWNQSGSFTVQAVNGFATGASIGTGGTLNIIGSSPINLIGGSNANGIATLTINGTLNTGQPINYNNSATSPARLTVSGGQIVLTANIPNLTTGNASTGQFQLGNAGGVINLNNFTITSTTAQADTSHLTAVGIATGLTRFEGASVLASDVLIKYTYYGDLNLDGKVDGSDYSVIDFNYLQEASTSTAISGWYNGDFNYDGVINGSDYTLMDNAFNTQGALIASEIAVATAQIAPIGSPVASAVPEPTTLALLGIAAAGLLGRTSRRRVR
jgi:autotransporter-associated beta strand protein